MDDREPFVVRSIGYGELQRLRVIAQEMDQLARLLNCPPEEVIDHVRRLVER